MTKEILSLTSILQLKENRKGLRNTIYNGVYFEHLSFEPEMNIGNTLIENTSFIKCKPINGYFHICKGNHFKNVIFDSIKVNRTLQISTHALLQEVTLKGSSKGALWIRPDEAFNADEFDKYEKWVKKNIENTKYILDISNYKPKSIEIIGLPIDKVIYNPEFVVAIKLNDFRAINIKDDSLFTTYFWKDCLRRLKVFKSSEGLFSLPKANDKYYVSEQVHSEKDYLIENGIIRIQSN